jgi:ADP-heptose:LPS heptosyltransferase
VALTGSRDEVELCLRVARLAGLPRDAVLAGRTDLAALAGAVAAADRVVCGDTGVGHLATAMGTPSVVLFGPTSPAAWGPPTGDPPHRALWAGQAGDPHGRVPHPGLLRIEPDEVRVALAELG